jgi:hypothetical protein
MNCSAKIRYYSLRAAKRTILDASADGDVTATHLDAYWCMRHKCYHIGNRSTPLKFLSFRKL